MSVSKLPEGMPPSKLKNLLLPLVAWASQPSAEADLERVFGLHLNWISAFRHLDFFRRADFSLLPRIHTLPSSDMPGLWGGYSRDTREIYLSADCPEDSLPAVLIEEIGHFLDQELCAEETPGEEGLRFASAVLALSPTSEWDDDALAPIFFDDRELLVEAARKVRGSRRSGGKKRGGKSSFGSSAGSVAQVGGGGGGSTNHKIQENIFYATEENVRIVQKSVGDRLIGSRGNDTFVVFSESVDIQDPNEGNDMVESSVSFSLLNHSTIENLALTGGAHAAATGNAKANIISGNSGNNLIDGGVDASVDTLIGGAGDDTYIFRDTLDQVVEAANAGSDVISTDLTTFDLARHANVEGLYYSGTSSNGVAFTGNSLDNSLFGSSGNDSLDGLAGKDSMVGGAGNDTYLVDDAGDKVFESANAGTDLVISTASSFTLGDNLENLVLEGSDTISGTGNDSKNSLTGNNASNTLIGLGGNDYIIGDGQLPSISFTGRNVSSVGQDYLLNGTNALTNNLGTPTSISNAGSFGERVVTRGDDNSSSSIDITPIFGANGLNLYGNQVKNIFINTNGNITFDNVLSTFSPVAIDGGIGTAIIAPFWADVDTRSGRSNVSTGGNSAGSNLIYWDVDDENRVLTITWDDVRYFGQQTTGTNADTKVNAFQLQLIDSGNGDAFVVFRYENVDWTTGTASGGTSGLGGQAARAGFNSGTGTIIELPQSGDDFSMLDLDQRLPEVGLNSRQAGVYIFEIRNGEITTNFGGNDSLLGGIGNDTLFGNGGNDTLLGEADDDRLDGGVGADSLIGGTGNDLLDGGLGADSMVGGAGNDTFIVDNSGDIVSEAASGGTDTVLTSVSYSLSAGVEVEILQLTGAGISSLGGNEFGQTLIGNSVANSLFGMGGNDSLFGGDGVDTLIGGTGNDSYFNDGSDLIIENAGGGNADYVESATTYTLAANLEVLRLTGDDTISGFGNAGNNTIIGNAANSSLGGGAGIDSLVGGAGNDTYFVDSGSDVVLENANEGSADLVVATVSYSLGSYLENLTYAGVSNVSLTGNGGDNAIDGSAAGINTLRGGGGNDTLVVNSARIGNIDGGTGTNWLRVLGDSLSMNNVALNNIDVLDLSLISTLAGSVGVTLGGNSTSLDQLIGSAKSDSITATEALAATIDGAAGDDRFAFNSAQMANVDLIGGEGSDTLAFTNSGATLDDSDIGEMSFEGIEVIELSGSGNGVTLGANAEAAGIATIVGGTDNDTIDASGYTEGITIDVSRNRAVEGPANTENTVVGGSAGDLIIFSNHNVLSASAIDGNEGIDTLSFAEDGVAITDDKFVGNIQDIEVLQTNDGTNFIQIGSNALSSGLKTIIGGAGEDTFDAAEFTGSIFIDAGAGADSITLKNAASTGTSSVAGGAGTDTLALWEEGTLADTDLLNISGVEVLRASDSGSNTLVIGLNARAAGIQMVIGGIDKDTLDARDFVGAVTLDGGEDNDSFIVAAGHSLRSQAVNGGNGIDTLSFTVNALSVTDTDFAIASSLEFLQTANGNNRIALGATAQAVGIATIQGGAGRDTLSASGYTRNVTLISGAGKTAALLGDSLIGGAGADSLVGSDKADVLNGGAGMDTMVGGLGNDTYYIGDDGDWAIEGVNSGANLLIVDQNVSTFNTVNGGGTTSFSIQGLVSISGGAGNDIITGDTLVNTSPLLKSTSLNDTIDGGAGNDTIAGGKGKDSLLGSDGNDSILGEEGNDTLLGGNNNDTILAGAGNDSVLGEAGNDSLVAGTGIDTLDGGNGNDTFVADAAGTAIFLGGLGNDVFQFSTPSLVGLNTIVGHDGTEVGAIADVSSTDTISLLGGGALADSAFLNVSSIEVLDASGLNASTFLNASLGTNAQNAGITTLTGSNQTDFLSAAEYNSGTLWILGYSGVTNDGDSLVAGSGNNRSNLVGSNGSDYFEVGLASLLGNHSIEGGSGNDTLFIKNIAYGQAGWTPGDQVLSGGDFSKVRNIEALRYDNRYQNTLDFMALGSGASLAAAFSGDISIYSSEKTNPSDGIGDDGRDVIDLSGITTKKVNLDVSHEVFGATITAGTINGTLRGGSDIFANDLFIFKQASWLAGATIVGGGGEDTLRIQGNGNNGAAAIDTNNFTIDIDVLDITGAGNEIILTPKPSNADITTVVGGSGPNTFTAASYTGLGSKTLYWDMHRSDGGDSIVGAATNDYLQIRNGFNLQNSVLDGGTGGMDTLELLSGGATLGDASFDNAANMDILILGSATNGNNITLGATHAQVAGIATVIGGTARETINASSYTTDIYIDASASSGARLQGSSTSNANTLIGASAGGNEFEIGDFGSNSIVGGSSGEDTLTFVNTANISDLIQNSQINDASTASLSNIGVLKFTGNNNNITLGKDALAAGIRTLVGGEGNDLGSSFDTSRYGTVGVVFQVTDQFYLNNSTFVGSAGVDTLKFSRDGVSVTEENVANLTAIDVLQAANGTNRFLMHDAFYAAGIDSIIGGTGSNIVDMMSTLYDPSSLLPVIALDDVITFDMSAGSYSLLVNDSELRYAKVVGGNSGGSVSIANDNGVVADDDFENLYDAKINTITYSGGLITLGENAMASGLKTLRIAGAIADVSDFNSPLAVFGDGANSAETVLTSFAALADLTFNGNSGTDTLVIQDSDARAITSLKGDFDVLVLGDGENFVQLGNDAGLSVIVGGANADTLNFTANTTGINFVMNASVLGDTDNDAQITGGTGSDILTVEFGTALGNVNTFVDTQLSRVSLGQSGADTLNGFSTDATGGNIYTFGTNFRSNLIQNIFAHANDSINASAVTMRELNFAFGSVSDFQTSTIVGTTRNDTLTLNITTPVPQAIADTDFGPAALGVTGLKSGIDSLVLNSLAQNAHADFTVSLGANAQTAGIRAAVGGNGSDSLDASAMTAAVTLSGGVNVLFGGETPASVRDTLVGGSDADSLHGDNFNDSLIGNNGADTLTGTSSTALGANEIDTLTGGGGNDLFILGDASNAYYNTAAQGGDYAIITDYTAGDIIWLKDLTSQFGTATDAPAQNVGGYVFGAARYGITGSGVNNSYLFVDNDKNGSESQGDNLVAVIQSATVLAFATSDLNDDTIFKFQG